jgi:3-oxoacid CoA-transferase B subunit
MSVDVKARIAERAALELHPGEIVNLGIGIPNLIPGFLGPETEVFLHTENGLLGVGPRPGEDEVDPDLIDAAKRPVTALPGAAMFDSAASFAMIRGGHVDVAVLGALQVSAAGDIANWAVPGKDVLGVGGAMDLVVGARRVIVTMTSTSSSGEPKVVEECTYPLTARAAADVVVTELCVFRVVDGKLVLTELLDGARLEDVVAATDAPFEVAPDAAGVPAGGEARDDEGLS